VIDEGRYIRNKNPKNDNIQVIRVNLIPKQQEQVLAQCPGVLECAAVGVADDKQGEAIKVFVVRSDPSLTEDDVVRYCNEHFTGYKRPKYIEFRDELPKTNVGKILRRALRDTA
jgi:acyl-CoA synthetase (AMP-forming)/AMP-acid ligase II